MTVGKLCKHLCMSGWVGCECVTERIKYKIQDHFASIISIFKSALNGRKRTQHFRAILEPVSQNNRITKATVMFSRQNSEQKWQPQMSSWDSGRMVLSDHSGCPWVLHGSISTNFPANLVVHVSRSFLGSRYCLEISGLNNTRIALR